MLLISAPNTEGGLAWATLDGIVTLVCANPSYIGIHATSEQFAIINQDQTIHICGRDGSALRVQFDKKADLHDVLIVDDKCYVVVTRDNAVLEIDYKKAIITQIWQLYGEADSSHINCLARIDGRICYSAFGSFTQHREYKQNSNGTGFIANLGTNEHQISNLSQPHSILQQDDSIYVCNSKTYELFRITKNERTSSGNLGGYTRGIAIIDDSIFVGISAARNETIENKTASIVVLDKESLAVKHHFPVPFREIYSIFPVTTPDNHSLITRALATQHKRRWKDKIARYFLLGKKASFSQYKF